MVANDSIKLYMLSKQYQKDIRNQSLFSKDYFSRKQLPISEEVDIYVMKKASLARATSACIRTFVFENFFEESELIDLTCSQPLTSEQVDRELAKTRKEVKEEVNEEIEKLEEEVQQKEKRIARISDEDEEVDYVNNSNKESSEKGLTDSKEEKMTFDETNGRKND